MTDLTPAEQAILDQFRAKLDTMHGAVMALHEILHAIEQDDIASAMGTQDDRQAALIALLPTFDVALEGFASTHMLLTVVDGLASGRAQVLGHTDHEPTEQEIRDVIAGFASMLAGEAHRFTVDSDGETEEEGKP